jgi:hypothetical protein
LTELETNMGLRKEAAILASHLLQELFTSHARFHMPLDLNAFVRRECLVEEISEFVCLGTGLHG